MTKKALRLGSLNKCKSHVDRSLCLLFPCMILYCIYSGTLASIKFQNGSKIYCLLLILIWLMDIITIIISLMIMTLYLLVCHYSLLATGNQCVQGTLVYCSTRRSR